MYDETKASVLEFLQTAPAVALTTDLWTSCATESYITITAHTIDVEFNLKETMLATREIDEKHTGANIAEFVNDVCEEFEINEKCEFIFGK